MKLRELRIERLPGIDAPFGLGAAQLGDGLHVVHGPNGIGKSSLVRALKALLWPQLVEGHAVAVEARFEADGRIWSARRDGRSVSWQCDGRPTSPPALPDVHLAHCWAVGLGDLDSRGGDEWFAQRVRLAMADEFDLHGTAQALFAIAPRHGFTQEDQLVARRRELVALEGEQERLLASERTLAELDAQVRAAAVAAQTAQALERALQRSRRAAQRREVELQLAAFPPGMANLPPAPAARLEELDEDIDKLAARLVRSERELEAAERLREGSRLEQPLASAELDPWRKRVDSLADLERTLRDVERDLAEAQARGDAAGDARLAALETQQRAVSALRSWIGTPAGAGTETWGWLALALLAAAGALVGWRLHPAGWLFVLAALGLGAWLARRGARGTPREAWIAEFGRTGLVPPASWQEAAVAMRLVELERELAEAHAARAGSRLDVAGLRARREAVDRERDVCADELCAWLSRLGEEPEPGAASLRAALAALERRSQACEQGRRESSRARADRDERRAELESRRAARARLFATLGLDESRREELAAILERYGAWEALAKRRAALALEVDEHVADDGLAGHDPEELAARLEAARASAGEHEALLRRAEEIRAELRAAGLRATFEEARAAEQQAREELEQKLEEALDALCGRALLEDVEREHARTSQPEVLREASELLRAFTAGRYGLDVLESDAGATLRALDALRAGRSLALGELSDGTRAQLLLAARLAFARRHEQGAALPLFLDDALAISDADRTLAVARSLALSCERDGRQVFVLLRDEGDARLVAGADASGRARTIDLAALREQGRAGVERARLALPPRREVPAPDGLEPSEWAERLGVPAPDPWRGVEAEHLYWLAPEDPKLLQRLFASRIERWGALQGLLEAGAAVPLDAGEIGQLHLAAKIHEAVRSGWRVGRGERVEREVLAAAGVSDRFLDGATELARELHGDARALIERLDAPKKDERVKGFHSTKRDSLVESLTASGHLDPREPLDEEAAWARLLVDVHALGEVDPADLRRRFEFLRARFDEAAAR